jgi:hypothetical protein
VAVTVVAHFRHITRYMAHHEEQGETMTQTEKILHNAERAMGLAHAVGGLDEEMDGLVAEVGKCFELEINNKADWSGAVLATGVLLTGVEQRVAAMDERRDG